MRLALLALLYVVAVAVVGVAVVGVVITSASAWAAPSQDADVSEAPTPQTLLGFRYVNLAAGTTIGVNCSGELVLKGNLLSCVAFTPTPTEEASGTATPTSSSTATVTSFATASTTPTPTLTASPLSTMVPTSTPIVSPTSTAGLTYYVSPSGNSTDGTSWGTAWSDFNRIVWASFKPGDRLAIDGGSSRCAGPYNEGARPSGCGVLYRTTLALGASGITVELSSEPGHDGTALLFGGRTLPLPSCNQATYTNQTTGVLLAGIALGSAHDVLIDGKHRSGIIQYAAQEGVQTTANSANVTLRNVEIFDNGVATHGSGSPSSFGSPATGSFTGWWADGFGIWLGGGSGIVLDRALIHDNGQDVLQGASTFTNWTFSSSWLYNSRENPLYAGYGFNTGPQQLCTHPDVFQVWRGGPNSGLTFTSSIIGPYISQGVYPTDSTTPQTNNVTITDTLFFQVRADAINTVASSPSGWRMSNVTWYRSGSSLCCALDGDNWPSSSVTNSINVGGQVYAPGLSGSGNISWQGEPLPGGTSVNPGFLAPLLTLTPHWADLVAVDLSNNTGKGSSLHRLSDITAAIDAANGE